MRNLSKANKRKLPFWFKLSNVIILLPILAWPIIFYSTIFFFDDPYGSKLKQYALFFLVNAYPLYLIGLVLLSTFIYKRLPLAGTIISLVTSSLIILLVFNFLFSDYKKDTVMKQKKRWMKQYETVKDKLQSSVDLNRYFTEKSIAGYPIHLLELGDYYFPTGNIVVRDPLVYICSDWEPYFITIPSGTYPLTIAVMEVEEDHYRYAAVRLKVSEKTAVVYEGALIGNENLESIEQEGDFFGFNVDAGLATIVDVRTRFAWCNFSREWHKSHEAESDTINIYDDLLADKFRESYKAQPQFQRSGGDWLNFPIPNTDYHILMFQTGWGDGTYPVYFGYDVDGEVCEVVIHFIDIELEMGK